ncbi:hypothetical protein [Rhodoferax sp.]|uniref:hypothetical protein n=1 Tax=Rhodoferax sp. TaxID=50421 RepID=UPI0028479F40|nr:hypothetical protein [Rhodoferax sp.]MDR3369075.1 hypothetical protein [Rhodoferax sp.]
MNIDAWYLEILLAIDLAELMETERGQHRIARFLYAEIRTACIARAVKVMREAIADLENPPASLSAGKARNMKLTDSNI